MSKMQTTGATVGDALAIRALPDYALHQPIAVQVEPIPEGFLATDRLIGRHGVGDTPEAAISDLAEAIQAMYTVLVRESSRLPPGLNRELTLLRTVVIHRDDVDDGALLARVYADFSDEDRWLSEAGLDEFAAGLDALDTVRLTLGL